MPSSPHATDGTTHKIRGLITEATKKPNLLEYSCNTSEERGNKANVSGIRTRHHAQPVYKKKIRTNQKTVGYRDPNRVVHLHTGHLQK